MESSKERRDPETASMRAAVNEVIQERVYQNERWGRGHDRAHTRQDWISILAVYLGKASSEAPPYTTIGIDDPEIRKAFRKRLVQIAAISLAAIEAIDQQ